ncbi:uncharacterized protein LOC144615122 [Panthera onca]
MGPGPSFRTLLGRWKGGGQGQRRLRPDNVLHSRRPRPITGRRLPAPRGATGHGSGPRKPGLWAAICGHPGAGRAAPQVRPARRRGPGARAPRRPRGTQVAHGGQDAPPPPARTRRCPFKTSLLPGPREASAAPPRGAATSGLPGWRRRRPLGQLPVPAGRPTGCEQGALPGQGGRGAGSPRGHVNPQPQCTPPPPAPASQTRGPGRRGRHAGHGRFARGAAPRARARAPASGPPHPLRVHGGGAPGRQPISAGRPGTAPEGLAGGRRGRESFVGGAAPRGGRGKAGVRAGLGSWARCSPAPKPEHRGSERDASGGEGRGSRCLVIFVRRGRVDHLTLYEDWEKKNKRHSK